MPRPGSQAACGTRTSIWRRSRSTRRRRRGAGAAAASPASSSSALAPCTVRNSCGRRGRRWRRAGNGAAPASSPIAIVAATCSGSFSVLSVSRKAVASAQRLDAQLDEVGGVVGVDAGRSGRCRCRSAREKVSSPARGSPGSRAAARAVVVVEEVLVEELARRGRRRAPETRIGSARQTPAFVSCGRGGRPGVEDVRAGARRRPAVQRGLVGARARAAPAITVATTAARPAILRIGRTLTSCR